MALGIIGILVGMVLWNYLTYKGLDFVISGFLSTLIIILTNGVSIADTWNYGAGTVGEMFATFGPLYVLGGIMGALYCSSGAIFSLMDFITSPFKKVKNEAVRDVGFLAMFLIMRVLLGLSGIDNMALIVTMISAATALFYACNFPRRYLNCLLMITGTVAQLVPNTPVWTNIFVEMFMPGYLHSGALVPRFLLLFVFIVLAVLVLYRRIARDKKKGIGFDPGPLTVPEEDGRRRPHWILTLIPLLAVYLCLNFLGWEGWLSMMVGTALCVALFLPYLPQKEGKSRFKACLEECNLGVYKVPVMVLFGMMPAYILSTLPAFDTIMDAVMSIHLPPMVIFALLGAVLVGLAADGGLLILCTIAPEYFVSNGSMTILQVGTIAVWCYAILDTLPINMGMIIQNEIIGTTMKESYPPIFETTVLLTTLMTIIAVVMCSVGII